MYRYSDDPQVLVDTTLAYPGLPSSLGVSNNIILDPSPTKILQVAPSVARVLPLNALAIQTNFLYDTLAVYLSAQEVSNANLNATSPPGVIAAILKGTFDSSVLVAKTDSFSVTLYDPFGSPFKYAPLWVNAEYLHRVASFQKYWWSSYVVQSTLDVRLHFDRAVRAAGSSLIVNDQSALNTAHVSPYSSSWNLTVFKVAGFDLMQLQLEYEGLVTRCVSSHAAATGRSSVEIALSEIPALQRLGLLVKVVADTQLSKVFNISFVRPLDSALRLLSDTGACPSPLPESARTLTAGTDITYRYAIRDIPAVLLSPRGYIPVGTYDLSLEPASGYLELSPWGVESDSVRYEYFSADSVTSYRSTLLHKGIARVTLSTIVFGSVFPNSSTSLGVSFCFGEGVATASHLTLSLPGVTGPAFTYDDGFAALTWFPANSSATIIAVSSSGSTYCASISVPAAVGLGTPPTAVYRDSIDFRFSYLGAAEGIDSSQFQRVSPIGIGDLSLTLSNPRYLAETALNVSFELAAPLMAGAGVISLSLPGFSSTTFTDFAPRIEGPFQYTLTVLWSQFTSVLEISSRFDLVPGTYYFVVPMDASYTSLRVAPYGISSLSPPTVAVSSSQWNMSATPIASYPQILAVASSLLNVSVARPGLRVSRIVVVVTLAEATRGPANFTIAIPTLWTTTGASTLLWTLPSGEKAIWRDTTKTLTVYFNSTWVNSTIFVSLPSPIGLTMRDYGSTTLSNSSIELYAANGFLLPSPVSEVVPVHAFLSSSLRFTSALFTTDSRYIATGTLNFIAYPGKCTL
jgi:hypothetical protein